MTYSELLGLIIASNDPELMTAMTKISTYVEQYEGERQEVEDRGSSADQEAGYSDQELYDQCRYEVETGRIFEEGSDAI